MISDLLAEMISYVKKRILLSFPFKLVFLKYPFTVILKSNLKFRAYDLWTGVQLNLVAVAAAGFLCPVLSSLELNFPPFCCSV